MDDWHRNSWREKAIQQDVEYSDPAALEDAKAKLASLPPLVSHIEVDRLRSQLADVAMNKRFLLQGGDCAELFEYCSQSAIENKLKVLLQMSLILVWAKVRPVRIARMAGQYAKPRSKPTEMVEGKSYPSFRGDNVNGMPLSKRNPDPKRLVEAYFHSAATINYARSVLSNGFADLHKVHAWDLESFSLDHVKSPQTRASYQTIVDRLSDSLEFMKTIGADSEERASSSMSSVDMFMSHEGLLLEYESQLTRKVGDKMYNLSSHYLWIGDRTRQLDGAHVEYFRGIENPIGVKVGPTMAAEELIKLLDVLDPEFSVGKVTLITRYGAGKIEDYLATHIKAVQKTKHRPVWCCDPMHGNTETVSGGVKTRRFENIVSELTTAFRIHKECGSSLNGCHFELTGEGVTEVMGGSMALSEEELSKNYQTFCDPRLNYEQSLDIAFLIAKYFDKENSCLNHL